MTQLKKLSLLGFSVCVLVFLFQAQSNQAAAKARDGKVRPMTTTVMSDQDLTESAVGYVKSNPSPGPRQNNRSESAGGFSVLQPSTTIGKQGDVAGGVSTLAGRLSGKDIHVRTTNTSTHEWYPAMASDSKGNLYVAWQDGSLDKDCIQVYYSKDGGTTWEAFQYVQNALADLSRPSLAVGEGTNGNTLLLAYVVNDGTNIPFIEVATAPLDTTPYTFTTHSVPYLATWQGYDKPVIWTDSFKRSDWNAYLVAEGTYDAAAKNVNVSFWRSTDGGSDWGTTYEPSNTLRGDTDDYSWKDPDGAYGCSGEYVFVVCFQENDATLYLSRSDDNGQTFGTDVAINTITEISLTCPVNPEIEAAATGSNVVVACTKADLGNVNIGQCYSTDNGATWSLLYTLEGATTQQEFQPSLKANEGGGDFHMLFTNGQYQIYYSRRPQDLSESWQLTPTRINDTSNASGKYDRVGITSNQKFDFPAFCWSDFRDGGSDSYNDNYDVYFDRLYPDDLLGTWNGQGVYLRTETGSWKKLATPATLIATGDLDGDSTSDLIGNWPLQGGVWVLPSIAKSWAKLAATAADLSAGDMDGDGIEEIVGTWNDTGVLYLSQLSGGSWVKMADPATLITTGDIDDDTIDDIIGVWPAEVGVRVKYSSTMLWEKIATTALHIAAGDMNGDGRDDLLGTWDGQGVFYRDSATGSWIRMASQATLVAAGDIDGDGTDDLIGVWPLQGGIWVKYSRNLEWQKLGTTAVDIAAGMMRGGAGTWGAQVVAWSNFEPIQGGSGPYFGPGSFDLSVQGPGAPAFTFQTQKNLDPRKTGRVTIHSAGPGEIGFVFTDQKNLTPFEKKEQKIGQAGNQNGNKNEQSKKSQPRRAGRHQER